MTHEPECLYIGGDVPMPENCIFCRIARAAYQRGYEVADHGDCICTLLEGQFWRDGSLRWIYVDGVKFVPAAARGDGEQA